MVFDVKKLRCLCLSILIGLLFIVGIVYVIDPLYQYHGPIFGMNEVLFDSSLQVEGTIKNFDYDSVLVGSSMVENADMTILEKTYDCKMIKVVKESGNTSEFLYYLNEVDKNRDITQVFWGMDPSALEGDLVSRIPDQYTPKYLFTNSVLDDYTYFFNKDIILKKIPNFIAYELAGKYGHEKSYSFADGKKFQAEFAMQNYDRQENIAEEQDFSLELPVIDQNIENIVAQIKSHKNVTYRIFYAPYSQMWWDEIYRNGTYKKYFYIIQKSLKEFCELDNVEVYFFMDEKEITCNLDNFMDMKHFKPEINQYILSSIQPNDAHRVQKNDVQRIMDELEQFFEYIISEGIYEYYTK